MAELKGKRFVIAAELEDGMRLSTSVVKKLCSTDEIAAEQKYKNPFKYRPSHTLVLYTNHLPRVGVSDDGTWRRLIVIPFNAKIEGDSEMEGEEAVVQKDSEIKESPAATVENDDVKVKSGTVELESDDEAEIAPEEEETGEAVISDNKVTIMPKRISSYRFGASPATKK